jgi:hypothetical protein
MEIQYLPHQAHGALPYAVTTFDLCGEAMRHFAPEGKPRGVIALIGVRVFFNRALPPGLPRHA